VTGPGYVASGALRLRLRAARLDLPWEARAAAPTGVGGVSAQRRQTMANTIPSRSAWCSETRGGSRGPARR
jgi:hypothetical protein